MTNPYRPEQAEAEAESARQEAIRQQDLERRLTEAEPAASGMSSADGEAKTLQLGERASATPVDAEVRLREMERPQSPELERTLAAGREVAPPTEQQVQEGAEALRSIPELRPEVWQGLNDGEKLEALQNAENQMAEVQGRSPVEVRVEQMGPGQHGGYTRGDRVIHVSQADVRSDNPREVLDTVVHEGRHAYQHYAVENPGFHSNEAEVEAWELNMQPGNYRTVEMDGARAYMEQPVEADAWSYASRVVRNVMGG